jgi:hypothetical protein
VRKQEILAKWQSIFASVNAPLLGAEFEKDITELLSDEEIVNKLITSLHSQVIESDTQELVKNILNNELD